MSYNYDGPRLHGGDVTLVPMDYMYTSDLLALGTDLSELVNEPATRDILEERHLDGVLVRHTSIDDSMAAVERAREQHLTTNDQNFGLLLGEDTWIGMGSLMRTLPLRVPRVEAAGLLPAAITRGSRILSKQVPVAGPNITAWVAAEHHRNRLSGIYRSLGELAGTGWTIEPVRSYEGSRALRAAGFISTGRIRRYDDLETGYSPPLAELFTYSVDVPAS